MSPKPIDKAETGTAFDEGTVMRPVTAPPPYSMMRPGDEIGGSSYNPYPVLPGGEIHPGAPYYPNQGGLPANVHQPLPQPIMYHVQPQPFPVQHAFVVNSMANNPPAPKTTVITTTKKSGVNHCLHAIITIFFFPWIIVWVVLCCLDSKEKRQTTVIKI